MDNVFNIENVRNAVKQHIKAIQCRPDIVIFPNSANTGTNGTLPYMVFEGLTTVTTNRFITGEGQMDWLVQIDIYTEPETGTKEMDKFVSAILEAFRNRNLNKVYYTNNRKTKVDVRGISASDLPSINEFGVEDGKYRVALTIPLRLTIS